jgi:hypothetical protein
MELDDFMNNKSEIKHEVDIGIALLRLLEMQTRNQRYIRTIFEKQLEIKSLLKGKTESDFDESFRDKVFDMEKKIWELGKEDYHKLLDQVLDNKK